MKIWGEKGDRGGVLHRNAKLEFSGQWTRGSGQGKLIASQSSFDFKLEFIALLLAFADLPRPLGDVARQRRDGEGRRESQRLQSTQLLEGNHKVPPL